MMHCAHANRILLYNSTDAQDLENSASSEVPETVYRFIQENGRTYHSHHRGGVFSLFTPHLQLHWLTHPVVLTAYIFPNDEEECQRLSLQGEIFDFVFEGRRHFAPLDSKKPLEVIDLGTGTGEWVCSMGDDYPLFNIQGTDLSPIQPGDVPPKYVSLNQNATLSFTSQCETLFQSAFLFLINSYLRFTCTIH